MAKTQLNGTDLMVNLDGVESKAASFDWDRRGEVAGVLALVDGRSIRFAPQDATHKAIEKWCLARERAWNAEEKARMAAIEARKDAAFRKVCADAAVERSEKQAEAKALGKPVELSREVAEGEDSLVCLVRSIDGEGNVSTRVAR